MLRGWKQKTIFLNALMHMHNALAIEHFVNQCHTVNLSINADKTKEAVLSFSRTCGVYDYLFISDTQLRKWKV